MKYPYVVVVIGTTFILIEGLFLSAFDVVVPSLLAIAILMIARYSLRPAWISAIWLGLVLDLLSTQVFGAYIVLAVAMFALTRLIMRRGLEMSRFVNIGLVLTTLIGLQLIWKLFLFAAVGISGAEIVFLIQYAVWQAILTWVLGFFLLRLLQVTMDI